MRLRLVPHPLSIELYILLQLHVWTARITSQRISARFRSNSL